MSNLPADSKAHTYHCLCSQLIFASTSPLASLPTRSSDNSSIGSLASGAPHARIVNTELDTKPTVIRLEDGFEKRYFRKCVRCDLIVAYHLDGSHWKDENAAGAKEDVVYLVQGGLQETGDMMAGKSMGGNIDRVTVKT